MVSLYDFRRFISIFEEHNSQDVLPKVIGLNPVAVPSFSAVNQTMYVHTIIVNVLTFPPERRCTVYRSRCGPEYLSLVILLMKDIFVRAHGERTHY